MQIVKNAYSYTYWISTDSHLTIFLFHQFPEVFSHGLQRYFLREDGIASNVVGCGSHDMASALAVIPFSIAAVK